MTWMIYGAYGYTGELIAREAVARGHEPILAGRRREPLQALADELNLRARRFGLDQPPDTELADVDLVIHCAGPFSRTCEPMLEACIATGTHYLDITGEIDVFSHCHAQHDRAVRAGCVVLPGAGFDVVPTDCLSAMLHERMPEADTLKLAFAAGGGPSQGTAKTSIEGLGNGGRARREGQMRQVPLAWKVESIEFADKSRVCMTIPWGDVYTAHVSTGIDNIEVFMAVGAKTARRMRRMRWLRPLFKLGPVQKLLKKRVDAGRAGPGEEALANTKAEIYGQVCQSENCQTLRLTTPNGYALTATSSVRLAEWIFKHHDEGDLQGGYYTPSTLAGADFVLGLEGVTLHE